MRYLQFLLKLELIRHKLSLYGTAPELIRARSELIRTLFELIRYPKLSLFGTILSLYGT